jgi:hypothetical protein
MIGLGSHTVASTGQKGRFLGAGSLFRPVRSIFIPTAASRAHAEPWRASGRGFRRLEFIPARVARAICNIVYCIYFEKAASATNLCGPQGDMETRYV